MPLAMRLVFFLLFLCHSISHAHLVEEMRMEFEETEKSWILGGGVDVSFMLPETRGVDEASVIRRWDVMNSTPEEQERMRVETEKTLRRCISFTFAGEPLEYTIRFVEFETQPLVLMEDPEDWSFFTVQFLVEPQETSGELLVHWEDETDATLIVSQMIEKEWTIWEVQTGTSQLLLSQSITGKTTPSPASSSFPLYGWGIVAALAIAAFFLAFRLNSFS